MVARNLSNTPGSNSQPKQHRKLTPEQEMEIVRKMKMEGHNYKAVRAEYGIGNTTISRILHRYPLEKNKTKPILKEAPKENKVKPILEEDNAGPTFALVALCDEVRTKLTGLDMISLPHELRWVLGGALIYTMDWLRRYIELKLPEAIEPEKLTEAINGALRKAKEV